MITVIPEDDHVMTMPEILAHLKGVASFLEFLPPDATLCSEDGSIVFVPQPHICAQALRLFLPAEGKA